MSEEKETQVVANETAVAVPEEVTRVYYDPTHEGVTGSNLPDNGRPTIYKIDAKTGEIYPLDDKTDVVDHILIVPAFARNYYRHFQNKSVNCTSDDGKVGWDKELKAEVMCHPQEVKGGPGCPYSYQIPKSEYPGQGQCSLGLTIQAIAIINDHPILVEMNLSKSSATAFSKYLKRLNRKQLSLRGVVTKMAGRYIETPANSWWAAEFSTESEEVPENIKAALEHSVEQARLQAAALAVGCGEEAEKQSV